MEFPRREYWSGLPFPSPEDLPNPEIEPGSPALEVDSLPSEPPGKPNQDMENLKFNLMQYYSVLKKEILPFMTT